MGRWVASAADLSTANVGSHWCDTFEHQHTYIRMVDGRSVVVVYISGPFVDVASERGADWPVDATIVEQLLLLLLFMVVGS